MFAPSFAPPPAPQTSFTPPVQPAPTSSPHRISVEPPAFEFPSDCIPKPEPGYTARTGDSHANVFVETIASSAAMRRASADPQSPPYSHNTPLNPRRTEKKFRMNNEGYMFAYYQSTSNSKLQEPLVTGAKLGDMYFHYNASAYESQFTKTGQMWLCVGDTWKNITTEYLRLYPEVKHPTWSDRVLYFSAGDNGEPSYVTASWWGQCVKKGAAFKGRQRSVSLGGPSGTPC